MSRSLACVLLALVLATSAACGSPRASAVSWGPVVVDPAAREPRRLLEARVSGEGAGDLSTVLSAAIAEARLGSPTSGAFALSVVPRERVVQKPRAHVVTLHFFLSHEGERIAEDDVSAAAVDHGEARRQAVARLLVRVSAALARSGEPNQAGPDRADFPAIVVLERVAHSRDLLELSFVETMTGAVVRREIIPLADAAAGPPGRLLLSRRTVEGNHLDDAGYGTLVRRVASFLDLRPVGDAHRLGYFGPKAANATNDASAPSASSPRTSTPPRR